MRRVLFALKYLNVIARRCDAYRIPWFLRSRRFRAAGPQILVPPLVPAMGNRWEWSDWPMSRINNLTYTALSFKCPLGPSRNSF
jgi:hypothetical protein